MDDSAPSGTESAARRSALDEVLVAELARGRSYEEAGHAVGWSARTVGRRMRDPVFRRRVTEMRAAWSSELTGRLLDRGTDAIDVIYDEARTAERSTDRLRAAAMLLQFGHRFRQTDELEHRLRAIEEQLGLREPNEQDAADAEGDEAEQDS